jgi:signal transduction histidine kinase
MPEPTLDRNISGLRTTAWTGITVLPLAGLALFQTLEPANSQNVLLIGGATGVLSLLFLAVMRGLPRLVERTVATLTFVLSVILTCTAICLCWVAAGFFDNLYAILTLVLVYSSIPQLFSWTLKRALAFCAVTAAFYLAPWMGTETLETPDLAGHLFLAAAMVGSLYAHHARLNLLARSQQNQASLVIQAETERETLDELKDMDRLKTGFYTSIVEGLRGPLTLMLSPLDSMLSGDVGDFRPNQIEYIETVRRNALKVLRLSDDLVDLSHLESGLLRLQSEHSNVIGLLEGIVDHATEAAESKGIKIGFSSDVSTLEIASDVEKLERAVTHLVATAIRYTSNGGRVDVRVDPHNSGLSLVIRDNGAGLPPDWLDSLGSATNKWLPPRSPEGVGLVLAREIILLHGGSFDVASRPETGTTFSVELPRGKESDVNTGLHADARTQRIRADEDYRFGAIDAEAEAATVEHAPSESKATKVLVVDDNPEILSFTKGLLSKDHAVFVASNGEDGLALAQTELPDVIITDTRMPKLDGTGLIRALRADPRLAQVPTIILTARNQVADREAARESGADMVMDKPFNPRELRTAIQELFAKQHRQASTFMNEQARSFEIISAGLAHEMHNPLAYIKNAYFVIGESARKVLDASLDPDLSPEDKEKRIQKAKDKIDKMLPVADRGIKKVEQLVALMRRYAREGYSSDAVEMNIDESISDVLAMIAPKDNKEVSIEPDLTAPLTIIKGVPEELQQAITNITQNAVDAVGKGGHVWVRTRPEARNVRIEIADDGPGIPREAMARIFTPFFTTKEVGKGMGLGLTITRQVIKQHGGTLEVDSTLGQGTTFTIRLPLATEPGHDNGEVSALEQAAAEEMTGDESGTTDVDAAPTT